MQGIMQPLDEGTDLFLEYGGLTPLSAGGGLKTPATGERTLG